MEKLSIIIPTMQVNIKVLNMLLEELAEDETIDEIILIDNSLKGFSSQFEKVRIITPKENLYVNPSWNLGVKEARNNYIGILNDDLLLPKNYCKQILEFLLKTENVGLVGINSNYLMNKDTSVEYPEDTMLKFNSMSKTAQTYFWGSAMFGKKKNFYEIPDNIKIWCGDNYLIIKNIYDNKQNYETSNANIFHLHASTSSNENFTEIKINDILGFLKELPNKKTNCASTVGWILRSERRSYFKKIVNKIFYHRKTTDKKTHVFNILGFKILFSFQPDYILINDTNRTIVINRHKTKQ